MAGLLGVVIAKTRGYRSTLALEAYRRAGAVVYDLLEDLEQGPHTAGTPRSRPVYRLCVWNAFALQTLGDRMLEADERLDPPTAGFVPPQTYDLVLKFYIQSAEWYEAAQEARSNPGFYPGELPAGLPNWAGATRYPRIFLEALLDATQSLRLHASAALADFERWASQPQIERLRQKLAQAETKTDYARRLLGKASPQTVHQPVVQHIRLAVSGYFRLGQFLAMPDLMEARRAPERLLPAKPIAGQPDSPRPDLWCMTDPQARPKLQGNLVALRAIEEMWASDPDPRTTLAYFEQIQEALAQGKIAYALTPGGGRMGHHRSTPFAAILVALEPIRLCGQPLEAGQLFSFEAFKSPRGGAFRRALVLLA